MGALPHFCRSRPLSMFYTKGCFVTSQSKVQVWILISCMYCVSAIQSIIIITVSEIERHNAGRDGCDECFAALLPPLTIVCCKEIALQLPPYCWMSNCYASQSALPHFCCPRPLSSAEKLPFATILLDEQLKCNSHCRAIVSHSIIRRAIKMHLKLSSISLRTHCNCSAHNAQCQTP